MPAAAILGGIQAAAGTAQAIIGSIRAKKAQRELENLQTPTTEADAGVNRLYQDASANPYDTAMYQMQRQNIGRGVNQGLGMLQDRRSALAGISGLIRGQNDALLRAGANAEQTQYGRLAQATQLKSRDNERVFGINKMLPYQKQFSLLGAKAAGANQMANAGFSNIFGGAQTATMGLMGNKQQQPAGTYNYPY